MLWQNWATWKKEMCFFALVYNIMMGAVLTPILASVGGIIVEEFQITFTQFALLNGWPLLTTGISARMLRLLLSETLETGAALH